LKREKRRRGRERREKKNKKRQLGGQNLANERAFKTKERKKICCPFLKKQKFSYKKN
jgi:hypothetical protein